MADTSMFGKAKYGGTSFKSFRLQPGSNLYRIGPAYRSLAASGKWFVYTKQHFGYRGAGDEQNPKGRIRTFVCPEEIDRSTEMVKVPCAECEKIRENQELVERKQAEYKAAGKTEAQIETLLGPIKGWLKDHNLDKKYLVLAKNDNQEWGVLSLPYKAKAGLDTVIKRMRAEENIDPLDMENGCWINFVREGEGFKTTYTAEAAMESMVVDGRRVKSVKQDALTDVDFEAIQASCPDLTTVGRRLTQDQIGQLVECNGDPDEVDRIFNAGMKVEKSPVREAAPAPKPVVKAEVKVQRVVEPEAVEPQTRVIDDEEAQLLAQLAAARAKKAKIAQVVMKAEPTPEVPEVPGEDLSDDEFLKIMDSKR
jgi:hypothetical protein